MRDGRPAVMREARHAYDGLSCVKNRLARQTADLSFVTGRTGQGGDDAELVERAHARAFRRVVGSVVPSHTTS
jgi:hypothetical protein